VRRRTCGAANSLGLQPAHGSGCGAVIARSLRRCLVRRGRPMHRPPVSHLGTVSVRPSRAAAVPARLARL